MPLKNKKRKKKINRQQRKKKNFVYINRHGINGSPVKPRPPKSRIPGGSKTPLRNPDKTSFKQLQKINRKGFFDKRGPEENRTPELNPNLRDNTYLNSKSTNHITPYRDELSKCDDIRQKSVKSFGRRNKSITLPKGYRNAQGISKRRMAKFEEELRFRPRLSKKSLMLASYMENPMERLTKRNSKKKRSKALRDLDKDLTFTPKINKKSSKLDKKRTKGQDRHLQLHSLAESYIQKRQQRKREKDMKISKEDLECVFQPELITNYTPEYVNELSFVERSYLWRQRRDQKIAIARNRRSKSNNQLPLKSSHISRSFIGETRPPRPGKHRVYRDLTDDEHHDLKVRSIKKSIERIMG